MEESLIMIDLKPIIFGLVMFGIMCFVWVGWELWRVVKRILKRKGKN